VTGNHCSKSVIDLLSNPDDIPDIPDEKGSLERYSSDTKYSTLGNLSVKEELFNLRMEILDQFP
jgi:hypothetical protein